MSSYTGAPSCGFHSASGRSIIRLDKEGNCPLAFEHSEYDSDPYPSGDSNELPKRYVTAPHRMWFEDWLRSRATPERWKYVYRLDQLRDLSDIELFVLGSGSLQLLRDPAFEVITHNHRIRLVKLLP